MSQSKRQYVSIERNEFESFLSAACAYEEVNDTNANEAVFSISLPHPDLEIRIFSTLEGGKSRGKGSDAIRTVIWHVGQDKPVGGRTKTLRIETWQENLLSKIVDIMQNWRDEWNGECPECDGVMCLRDGKYGEFLGCSSYPRCKHTENL